MAKYDLGAMPNDELCALIDDATSERDDRIEKLASAGTQQKQQPQYVPTRRGRPRNGASEAPAGDLDREAVS